MEFPDLGEHCAFPDCNQLDFTPFRCQCTKYFCKNHFLEHFLSGTCPNNQNVNKAVNFDKDSTIYRCDSKHCKNSSFVRLPCEKCDKHFCISHRFHDGCYNEIDEEAVLESQKITDEEAKNEKTRRMIEAEVTQRLRSFEQTSKAKTAIKILLMKLKMKAVGEKTIPGGDRVYFAARKPSDESPKSLCTTPKEISTFNPNVNDELVKPVFVSRNWSLGRVVDSIANLCNIKNYNTAVDAPNLRMFRESDGMCVSLTDLSVAMQQLIDDKILVDGDRIFFDYVSKDNIKSSDANLVYFVK